MSRGRKPSAAARTVPLFTTTQASGTGQRSLFEEPTPSELAKLEAARAAAGGSR